MTLIEYNTINEFNVFLKSELEASKIDLEKYSKFIGKKLREKEKELENDKEFLAFKEKLEEKTDDKKKKRTKKQVSGNWINHNGINLYNGMGVKGQLEIYFKEIEQIKLKIEKLKSTKQSLDDLTSKGLKNNLNCIVFSDSDNFELVLLKTAITREKFSYRADFTTMAKLEKPLFAQEAFS